MTIIRAGWCAGLLLAAALPLEAQPARTEPESPMVVVTGEGLVKAAPDQAWVQVGAETATPIAAGEFEIRAQVTVTAAIR